MKFKKIFLFLIILILLVNYVSAWNFLGDGVVEVSGTVDTSPNSDFFLDVSKGDVEFHSSIFKFGRSNVGSSEEVIWDGSGDYNFLSSAETLVVVSDDTDDNFYTSGLGARVVIVYGLDNDFNMIQEVVLLNGTTPVITSQSFRRTFRALVVSSGIDSPVSDANQGTISFTSSTSSSLQAQILPSNGQTLMAVYTVPACYDAYVTGVGASVGEGKSLLVKYKFRNAEQDDNGAFSVKYTVDLFEQALSQNLQVPLKVPAKTDVAVTGISASAGTSVSASFGAILVEIEGCVV